MLRVVSWNVLADAYVRREYYPHTKEVVLDRAGRRRAVADRLVNAFSKVDVLCLQEVDSALFAAAEEKLTDHTGRLFRKRGKGEGCAIFVRHAVTTNPEWKELAFSDRSGHVALGVTFAGITAVSTHLKWEPPGTAKDAHRGRGQLAEILDTWSTGSRIICGDFNDEPGSDVLSLAVERGLKDAYESMPNAYTCNANNRKKRIDFILCSSNYTTITPSPMSKNVTDDTPLPGDDEPSDHLPIEALLSD